MKCGCTIWVHDQLDIAGKRRHQFLYREEQTLSERNPASVPSVDQGVDVGVSSSKVNECILL